MRILVTGGAGFIGSHIVDSYIESGHDVVVVDNLSTGNLSNLNPKAIFYKMDIRDTAIEDIFDEHKPEVVNHHAAQVDVRKSVADPVFDASTNILGIVNLLDESLKNRVKKFIFASSGGVVYGEPKYLPVDLKHPLQPLSPYGASKHCSEIYLEMYRKLADINHVILRYGNIFGPRQDPAGEAGVVAIFLKRILAGESIIIFGDGNQTRDYVYISDVVDANNRALSIKSSAIVNIGTGIGTSVKAIYELLSEILDKFVPVKYEPSRLGELQRIYLMIEENDLNWRANIGFKEGLKRTVDSYKDGG